MRKHQILMLCALSVLLTLSGCANVPTIRDAWNNAQCLDTEDSYRSFLNKYPTSYFSDIARKR